MLRTFLFMQYSMIVLHRLATSRRQARSRDISREWRFSRSTIQSHTLVIGNSEKEETLLTMAAMMPLQYNPNLVAFHHSITMSIPGIPKTSLQVRLLYFILSSYLILFLKILDTDECLTYQYISA